MRAALIRLLCFLTMVCPAAAFCGPRYELSAAAIFQNEAPYLKEWIEFHRLMGVEHFYLYNNESVDDYRSVLEAYLAEGVVELIDWPNLWPEALFHRKCQLYAYNDALERCRGQTEWLAILDIDEFLFPVQEESVVAFLRRHCAAVSGLCVNWQCYGTAGVRLSAGDLLTERLLLKAAPDHKKHLDYNSIVRPDDVTCCPNQHYCLYREGKVSVNGDGAVVDPSSKWCCVDKIRVNHYWLKDAGFFCDVKAPRLRRRGFTQERLDGLESEFNVVYDDAILRFVPALRRRLGLD